MILQRPFSIRYTLLGTIAALTLLIVLLTGYETVKVWQKLGKAEALNKATMLGSLLFIATEHFSKERGITNILLNTPDEKQAATLQLELNTVRLRADKQLRLALEKWSADSFRETHHEKHDLATQQLHIQSLRARIDHALTLSITHRDSTLSKEWFEQTTLFLEYLQALQQEWVRDFIGEDSVVAQHIMFKHFLGIVTEYAGRERTLIGQLIVTKANPTSEQHAQLLQWRGIIGMSWNMCKTFAQHGGLYSALQLHIEEAESHYFENFNMLRDMLFQAGSLDNNEYPISAPLWFELATQAIDSLEALNGASLKEVLLFTETRAKQARQIIFIHLAMLLAALALCFYSFRVILYRVLHPVHNMVEALYGTAQTQDTLTLPATGKHQDEIGKLSQVLSVFKAKVEEVQQNSIALQRYIQALERSNKELDDFAYIASHDLKEPLRGIHNHSRFLLEDNEKTLQEDSVNRLHRLVYLSQRMEQLVNDLLYFSRLGRHELALKTTNLNIVIEDIKITLEHFLSEYNGHIVLPQPLPTIKCDGVRLAEVFRNLITNAIKYNENEEKKVEIGWLASTPDTDENLMREVFYVKDNGKGIAPEFHEEIFRIFRRLNVNKNQKEIQGTGVGLTFVKKIIERHGGKIWLASEPGKGSVFYFTLGESI